MGRNADFVLSDILWDMNHKNFNHNLL